jgi:peptidoglycan hydrolase CwlO-like protein
MSDGVWLTLAIGLSGTLIGTVSTIVVAVMNRQPMLAAAVDSRIAVLIETYERTIGELRIELGRLEAKIDLYEKTIRDLRDHIGKLEAKIDVLQAQLKEAGAPTL